jgi:hypothetical protein
LTGGRDSNADLIVYLVISPDSGPGYRIISDEVIQASGGIHAIERSLEKESYWFVRLGNIREESTPYGGRLNDSDFASLSIPPEDVWCTGRRNPAYGKSELERYVFKAVFRAVERMLDGWKREQDGVVDAYALKELKISSERLGSVTDSLRTLPRVHEIAEITVFKYWYEQPWPMHVVCDDLVLAEYSLKIPLQFRQSASQEMFCVEIMHFALC